MTHWHPILAAVEVEPGQWELVAQTGSYAVVRLLTIGGVLGYRVVTYTEPRQIVGYFTTLRAACAAAHGAFLRRHGPDPSTDQYPHFLTNMSDRLGKKQSPFNT